MMVLYLSGTFNDLESSFFVFRGQGSGPTSKDEKILLPTPKGPKRFSIKELIRDPKTGDLGVELEGTITPLDGPVGAEAYAQEFLKLGWERVPPQELMIFAVSKPK